MRRKWYVNNLFFYLPILLTIVQQEQKFLALKISAIAINEDTLVLTRKSNRNLWQECVEDATVILLSPELLTSQPFDCLLQNRTFTLRLCLLGIDEVQVQDWGIPSFRDAFRHIALVHACMPRGTIIIGLTATLLAGQETTELLKTLGFTPGTFFFQRRSNIRRDVQDIYRVLRHGLSGWIFLDLDWIIEGDRKTLIYCPNYALCFRLHIYYYYKHTKLYGFITLFVSQTIIQLPGEFLLRTLTFKSLWQQMHLLSELTFQM